MTSSSIIETWLAQLPEEEIERELAELQERFNVLSWEIQKRRDVLDLKRRFREYDRHAQPQPEPEPDTPPQVQAKPASVPAAVLTLITAAPPGVEWSVADLKDGLVANGWLEDTPRGLKTLLSTLSRMTSSGQLERVGRGRYKLPASSYSPSPFAGSDADG